MGVAKKIIEGGLKAVAKKAPRMSEALEPHIGKRLYITQADRTALDYPQGLLGGPGYTELATIDPAKYKDIAWAVQSPGVAKTLVGSMARNPEEAVFANLIGSPEQHRSNKVVFNKIMDRFQKAVEEDKLTPELHKTINKRLANIKDPKTGKSFFPENVDILSPEFEQHAQTFHQRAFIADILAGKGVGGRKGTIIDYPSIIKETTDPLLLEAKTGDIGDRLFSLSGNIQERPEPHPAFHYSLSGKKESEAFAPAPQGIVLKDFTKDFTERTGRMPTYYDLTRGYAPSEKITEEMIERMYKEGYAKGGKASKGKRLDNTKKERGFLGEIRTPRGDFMTEMSVGEPNTDELFRPSIVPNVHPAEINYMIQTGEVPTDLYPISQRHAEKRISEGKSPFWNEKEDAYADGGAVEDDTREITQDPTAYLLEEVKPINTRLGAKEFRKRIGSGNLFGRITGDIVGGVKDIAEDTAQEVRRLKPRSAIDIPVNTLSEIVGFPMDITESYKEPSPIRSDIVAPKVKYITPLKPLPLSSEDLKQKTTRLGITSGEDFPNLQMATGLISPSSIKPIAKGTITGARKLGKFVGEGLAEQIETGTGMLGRNVINPRMNIIKDPGGMLVGGEKALDDELIAMKKNEAIDTYDGYDKDPNAVALNNWIDTKVRKYIRNQAGTEADPILKTIESGVEHNFQPTMGDTKYSVRNKRLQVGKPEAGIAKTELGKEFEYKIDSMFDPKSSEEVKAILNDPLPFADPNTAERFRASKLRTEHDLPIQNEKDVEALRLLNEIPDKNIYTLSGTNITDRLGLNHVSDVLMEDLQTGRLRPEQLNQMSIEKAIRRTAEYDAQKAREMQKAHATSIEGFPVPKAYEDKYKWVELKHETDPKKTAEALKSEGQMMGHCVGGGDYCYDVEHGTAKIFSLRGPDGKSHVTIEARPHYSAQRWYEANADLINSDPYLKEIESNVAIGDIDAKYGNNPSTDADYVRIMSKEMKRKGINPVEPAGYMNIHQIKGGKNHRPEERYQKYISDFIQNNPTKHEIVDIHELDNTNLMSVQNIADTGLVPKDIHFHPDVLKATKARNPKYHYGMSEDQEEMRYDLFKEVARDLARQGKSYLDKDDILNHLREKYLLPKKKSGGSINLNQEYKLENLRRRYG